MRDVIRDSRMDNINGDWLRQLVRPMAKLHNHGGGWPYICSYLSRAFCLAYKKLGMAAKARNITIKMPATAFQRMPAFPYRLIPKSAMMPKTTPLKIIMPEKNADTNASRRVAGTGLPALAAVVKIVTPILTNGANRQYVAA
jgi:hypothetical protein